VGIVNHWRAMAMTQSVEDKNKNDVVEAAPSTPAPDTSEDLDVFVKELMDNSKLFSRIY
jgi:hypothetical protein